MFSSGRRNVGRSKTRTSGNGTETRKNSDRRLRYFCPKTVENKLLYSYHWQRIQSSWERACSIVLAENYAA